MNEIEIIKQARRQDRNAQASLYARYERYWFTICLRYHSARQDAEDCLQNALVNIFSNLDQFDPERGAFKAWSAKIIVNENLKFLRDRQTTHSLNDYNVSVEPKDIETNQDALAPEKLVALIRQLPEGYRAVFNLYVMEGYSHREIAAILDISEGTSKSQLHKARQMLQRQLEVLL